jgi:hypothetical protein
MQSCDGLNGSADVKLTDLDASKGDFRLKAPVITTAPISRVLTSYRS